MTTAMTTTTQQQHFLDIDYPFAKQGKGGSWDADAHNHARFVLQGVHYSIANSVRRAMIAKVPTIGFKSEPHNQSTIKIDRNDTYLNNQIIAHRLAMIPIHAPHPEQFEVDDYVFYLDVSNDTNTLLLVTTEHFKIKRISTNAFLSEKETRMLLPADPLTGEFFPIVKLKPKYYTGIEQVAEAAAAIGVNIRMAGSDTVGIKLNAKLVKSTGDENGHFSPVAACSYGNTRDPVRAAEALAKFVEAENAKNVASDLTPYSEESLVRRFNLNEVQRWYKVDENGEPTSFDFVVESVGVIPPLICLERGFQWLVDAIERMISNLETGNEKSVIVRPVATLGNGFEIIVEGEDDTLGNVIQCGLIRQYASLGLEPENRRLASVSYFRTHPLERRIIITIKPIDSANMDECIANVFIPGCRNIITELRVLIAELTNTIEYQVEAKHSIR
jgi:DNA-directed RNA polymerase subunit L